MLHSNKNGSLCTCCCFLAFMRVSNVFAVAKQMVVCVVIAWWLLDQNAEPTPEEVAAEEAEQHAAAVKIQAIQRGNATRKELERIKSTKTNEEDADVAKDADAGKSPKKDSAPKKSGVSTPVGKARGGKPNANAPKAKPATTARKGR